MKCLKCEKEMQYLECGGGSNLDDGGDLDVSFHYGSRHDMCLGFDKRKEMHPGETRRDKLMSCDHIQAYICDDCFEKHIELFDGYNKNPNPRERWVRVVG